MIIFWVSADTHLPLFFFQERRLISLALLLSKRLFSVRFVKDATISFDEIFGA
jgi:hypothetical protein